MDPKFDINPTYTISCLLASNAVRRPHELTYAEMVTVVQNVIQLEAAMLRG